MIAFKDKAGREHSVDNMSFAESKNGSIKCLFLALDAFGDEMEISNGKGFSLSEAFLQALDALKEKVD